MIAIWHNGHVAVSTNTQFAVAVHVLTFLAGAAGGGPVSSEQLSESTNVTPVYIRRVLGPLREAGLVSSRPGAHGGWELAANPGDINLARVWRLLQGADPLLGLHGPNPACSVGRGVQESLIAIDRAAAGAAEAALSRFTIRDVLRGVAGASPQGR